MAEAEKNETQAIMDAAAEAARAEFMDTIVLNAGSAKDVAKWLKNNFAKAGYKRLCKILIEYANT
jgi:hypothetical protein